MLANHTHNRGKENKSSNSTRRLISLGLENLLLSYVVLFPRIITFHRLYGLFVNSIITSWRLEWSASNDLQLEKGGRG